MQMESASCRHRGRAAPNFRSYCLAAPGIVASLSEETMLAVTRLFPSVRVTASRDAAFAATPHTTCPDEANKCQQRSSCHVLELLEVFQLCHDLRARECVWVFVFPALGSMLMLEACRCLGQAGRPWELWCRAAEF